MTYAYIEKPLHDYYRARYPNLQPRLRHRGAEPDARRRPARDSLRHRRRARSFRARARRLPDHRRPPRAAQGRRPRDRHRRAAPACRSSSSATSRPTCAESEPFYERAIRPHVDGVPSSTTPQLPNAEVLGLMARARAFLFPISWEEPFGLVVAEAMAAGHARHRDAARLPARARRARASRDFSARPTRSSRPSSRRAGEIDRAACRRRAEERFSAERMVSDYEALYRRILA